MRRVQAIDAFVQDISFAFRTLGRQKGWATVAVLTLALGIGANTAVFSVVSSLLLHPLPYPHADRVATVFLEPTQGNQTGMRVMVAVRPPTLQAWRASSHSFEALEPYTTGELILRAPGAAPTSIGAGFILPTFPQFAGERPLLGRGILASESLSRFGRIASFGRGTTPGGSTCRPHRVTA
jgi:putative ABC transport system permease protein